MDVDIDAQHPIFRFINRGMLVNLENIHSSGNQMLSLSIVQHLFFVCWSRLCAQQQS